MQQVTPQLASHLGVKEPRGALVLEVAPGSPAAQGGLRRGDVIVRYDGREIRAAWELRNLIALTPVGKRVKLSVIRRGIEKDLYVTIRRQPERSVTSP